MEVSHARCSSCGQSMTITRVECTGCSISMQGEFEVGPLGRLTPEDQVFVQAFLRHHGSIKKMESLFGVSYPTVKNRLNAIADRLEGRERGPTPNAKILEQLAEGTLSVAEALEKLS